MPAGSDAGNIVVLAGGTGGAKLARGLAGICGERLTVIANTGDDVDIYNSHVSPDPDLCLYWLADMIDERGWGIAGDTFTAMETLRATGADVWFNLGDEDLAVCRARKQGLASGSRLTDELRNLGAQLGVAAAVLPMSDDPVQTTITSRGRRIGLQEFLIREQGAAPIDDVTYVGAESARASAEVLAAIDRADAIIIGPSNPILSIGPILAIEPLRQALRAASAPIVAVSPIVGGHVLKGPTAACLSWAGRTVNASGIASHYGALLDGLVSDEVNPSLSMPHLTAETNFSQSPTRESSAAAVLEFAESLS